PASGRSNLHILTHATITCLDFDGSRASGASCYRDGQIHRLQARREVIVCAGALQTPALLMRSGLGPQAHLQTLGIDVRADIPGIGQNLQDHLDIVINRRVANTDLLGFSLVGGLKFARAIWRWHKARRGVLTSNFAEAGAFVRSLPELDRPDLQLHFVVGMVDDHNRRLHWGHGMSLHACALQSHSRGQVRLANTDPFAPPLIDPRFLSDERDLEHLLRGFKLIRKLFAQPAFAPFGGGDPNRELHFSHVRSDDDIRAAIRAHADTIYHPAGTCRMGDTDRDRMAVCDAQLRVRGVQGLRVADGSVMPSLVSGNPNAAIIMIAEKAARMIIEAQTQT
ncbi:MAG TPA: GMC oxidoreductase, partial [Burkholderiaceae bacterium]|nr:GMC oxidoreductase [Burkholderiaceae bacterium]